MIGIANVGRSSQVFTLFEGFQFKKTPCSRRLIVKSYTHDLENHTLFSGTCPHRPNKGVPRSPPPPGLKIKSEQQILADNIELQSSVKSEFVSAPRKGRTSSQVNI